ncbi:uncharacterized protein MKZ38_005289 [Zalerion maritima]|uniref:Mitochondrial fusion and transport protein ugo1 n=1 Tax=Zalerion maritima TaxID=339359 RepID=A0AAD5WPC6_9PEZI|nr:uncharacterized protein MKZ38_005289 [Zalerion maritima]
MSSNREGVNPLRPYYIPPSIGEPLAGGPAATPRPNPFSAGPSNSTQYANKARDIFSDIDYKDYISEPSPSVVKSIKDLIDELSWKYTSILMSQPFEVAKTILQVRAQDDLGAVPSAPSTPIAQRRRPGFQRSLYDLPDSDQDDDEPAYFTSSVPNTPTPLHPRNREGILDEAEISSPESPRPKKASVVTILPHQLDVRRPDSILDVISQLWTKEGAWGVWKGSNATFLYSILESLLENWTRSLLSALFNVPDLGVKDDIDRLIDIASPYPWVSLVVAAGAAVATGLILSPLDLIRTRLLVTPTSRQPRRTVATLRELPSYVCAPILIIPTILNSLIHPLLTLSTPLVLRSQFMIDREVSPTTFSVAKFCTSSAALFVKLPLETVLRRGQVAVLLSNEYAKAIDKNGTMQTIVHPGKYNGVFGTMYSITSEEGSRPNTAKPLPKGKKKRGIVESIYRRGQGMEGLWRGWKVSWWGLVGLWTASLVSGSPGQGEF